MRCRRDSQLTLHENEWVSLNFSKEMYNPSSHLLCERIENYQINLFEKYVLFQNIT